MATFVLVHGAWHGGWCWAPLERQLQQKGHQTHAPTLTGLGERSHLLSRDITPDLHVRDIVNTFNWREIEDAILVGHSYAGIIITGVAGLIPARLRGLVYLDAFVPEESRVSPFTKANPHRMAAFQKQIDAGALGIEPDFFHAWTDDPAMERRLRAMCTPQPDGCFDAGVTQTGREAEVTNKAYILCTRNQPSVFWAEYERVSARPEWQSAKIRTKHNAMGEGPETLATLLDGLARQWAKG